MPANINIWLSSDVEYNWVYLYKNFSLIFWVFKTVQSLLHLACMYVLLLPVNVKCLIPASLRRFFHCIVVKGGKMLLGNSGVGYGLVGWVFFNLIEFLVG